MVSILPLIYIFSSLFCRLLWIDPSVQTTIGITIILMFHSLLVCFLFVFFRVFFFFCGKVQIFICHFSFFHFLSVEQQNPRQIFFFFLIDTISGVQNPRKCYGSHSLGLILVRAYTIWWYCQFPIPCTIPCWLPFPPSHALYSFYVIDCFIFFST